MLTSTSTTDVWVSTNTKLTTPIAFPFGTGLQTTVLKATDSRVRRPQFCIRQDKKSRQQSRNIRRCECVPEQAQGQLVYPDDWQPMEPSALPANDLPPGPTEMTVGPFTWTPSTSDSVILMAVSATGDASNLAKFSDGKSISDWRLVPHDNNIGMRKV
jgi:hypothetical protein